ncbi:hypothetical protein ACVWZV_001445 [Bradyrhizobium sp. GM5.1]
MKLTSEQVKQTVNQLGAQVLPDEHPAMPQLNSMFGEHTFFVDETGLKVVEPHGAARHRASERRSRQPRRLGRFRADPPDGTRARTDGRDRRVRAREALIGPSGSSFGGESENPPP